LLVKIPKGVDARDAYMLDEEKEEEGGGGRFCI
jgi:hypothetical protein